jgi:hypothetical protein
MLRCMKIARPTHQANGQATAPIEWPPRRLRNGPRYLSIRTEQLVHENERLGLPARHAVMLTYLQLESEAERQSRLWARRASWYSSLYVTLGLPAAILAAIAGATALASSAGRYAAGVIALLSSALTAAVTFLDSGKKRDQAAVISGRWDDLYDKVHVCRLTELSSFTADRSQQRLATFYAMESAIRSGKDPEAVAAQMQSAKPPSAGNSPPLFTTS